MTATDRALELVRTAAQAASDKQAENIVAFDVSEQLVITDAFLLASASNDRQVKSIVDAIEDALRAIGAKPVRREGERDGRRLGVPDVVELDVRVPLGPTGVVPGGAAVPEQDEAAPRGHCPRPEVTVSGRAISGQSRHSRSRA